MPWMYILRCHDGSYYIGSTTNLEIRLAQHQAGEGGRWNSQRLPVELAYSTEFHTLDEAAKAEIRVKGWRRRKKEALIQGRYELLPELANTSKK
ncbi:MAG: GIY-YIG nuclease family protein [bacterium]